MPRNTGGRRRTRGKGLLRHKDDSDVQHNTHAIPFARTSVIKKELRAFHKEIDRDSINFLVKRI